MHLLRKIWNTNMFQHWNLFNFQKTSRESILAVLENASNEAVKICRKRKEESILLEYYNKKIYDKKSSHYSGLGKRIIPFNSPLLEYFSHRHPKKDIKKLQKNMQHIEHFISIVALEDGGYFTVMNENNGKIIRTLLYPIKNKFELDMMQGGKIFSPITQMANRLPEGLSQPARQASAHEILIKEQNEEIRLFSLPDYQDYMKDWKILKSKNWIAIFSTTPGEPAVCLTFLKAD